MPSISYDKYCKIAGIDGSKTSEKKESKNYEKMQKQSYSELFGAYGVESLSHFTVAELKEELSARNLGTQGVKADLISRLEESYKSESSKDHKRKSPERDAGDKKHQKTSSSMELDVEGKNPGNVAGGYKATLHNPNSSEEAKEHARKMLKEMGEDETPKADQEQDFDLKESLKGKHKGNVIGGYKATLHNPNSSEEAKEKARAALEEMGVDPEEKAEKPDRSEPEKEKGDDETVDEMDLIDPNNKRVIGGYKATIHNPNSSEEAKEHARSILKKLGVDPEAKEADHQGEVSVEGKNPGNVIGGYKAAAHNPNLPEESREHAKEVLEQMGVDADEKAETQHHQAADKVEDIDLTYKHKGNVIGGYRATLHNPNSSDEAKEHAKKMLKEMGVDPEGHADSHHQYASAEETAQDTLGKNPGNVIGGYRATLHNPNSSEEAKEHARKELKKLGADPEGHADPKKEYKHADTEGKNLNNVAGGYKATLSNPNASQEAKDHAQKELDRMGVDANETTDSQKTYHKADTEGKNVGNVIGGYKATLKNPNVSDEAKENAEEQLEKLDAGSDSKKSGEADTEGKNINNVIGGYKATLKNPNVSEEAKDHAKTALENLSK